MRYRTFLAVLIAAVAVTASMVGCSSGGQADEVAPVLLVSDRGEDGVYSIGSDDSSLYLGGLSHIARVDKATNAYEVLAAGLSATGSTIDDPIEPPLEHPENFASDGTYLYYDASGYGLYRLPLGAGYSSVEFAATSDEMELINSIDTFALNHAQAFWATSDGTQEIVYARPLAGGSSHVVTTAQSAVRLAANDAFLYVCPTGEAISRYDLVSGQVLEIPAGNPSTGVDSVIALSDSAFFWADAAGIHRIAHDGATPDLLVGGLTGIYQLLVDGTTLYALQASVNEDIGLEPPVNTVYTVDLATPAATPLFSAESVGSIIVVGGVLYWTSGNDLHARASDGSTNVIFTDASYANPIRFLCEVSGKIALVPVGGTVRTYDPATGTIQELPLVYDYEGAAGMGDVLYLASGAGILRVPVDVPLRIPETLRYGLGEVDGFALHGGWIYWSEHDPMNPSSGVYRIARMRTDGSSFEELFGQTHRGMLLDDQRLYFACESACGEDGWTLVSMPLDGGATTPVAPLHLWPNDFAIGEGHAVINDSEDGITFNIYSIDLTSGSSAKLVSGLLTGVQLHLDDGWLYMLDVHGAAYRYEIHDWTSTGPAAPIVASAPSGVSDSIVTALHAASGEYFTWQTGVGLTDWK